MKSESKQALSFLAIFSLANLSLADSVAATLPGALTVNNLGRAMYSIPIEVTPGLGGMQPDLSLEYSSGGGNGIMGAGWSLSGLSAISVTGKNLAQDGEFSAPTFDLSEDRLALDGQRLVCVTETYGAIDAEYRTEVESFAKVTTFGTSSVEGFVVKTKDGLIYHYGKDTVSGQGGTDAIIQVHNKRTGQDVTVAWALKILEDRNGNYIRFTYGQSSVSSELSNEFYPELIEYTFSSGQTAFAQVDFIYDPTSRSDARTGYAGNLITSMTQKLDRIEVKVGGSLMNKYVMGYSYAASTGDLLLDNIQMTAYDSQGGDPIAVPQTVFEYQDERLSTGLTSREISNSVGMTESKEDTIYRDLDDDGTDESYTLKQQPQYSQVDLDGDGTGEVVRSYLMKRNGEFYHLLEVFEYDKVNDEYDLIPEMTVELLGYNNNWPNPQVIYITDEQVSQIHFGDFTGDGLQDVVLYARTRDDSGGYLYGQDIFLILGWDGENWVQKYYRNQNRTTTFSDPAYGSESQIGDFDNDGIMEFALINKSENSGDRVQITLYDTSIENILAESDYLNESKIIHESLGKFDNAKTNQYQLLDFTSDGLVDLMVVEEDGSHAVFHLLEAIKQESDDELYMGATDTLNHYYKHDLGSGSWDSEDPYVFYPGDLNQDGAIDFLRYKNRKVFTYISNGGAGTYLTRYTKSSSETTLSYYFDSNPQYPAPCGGDWEFSSRVNSDSDCGPISLYDIDGDGFDEICFSYLFNDAFFSESDPQYLACATSPDYITYGYYNIDVSGAISASFNEVFVSQNSEVDKDESNLLITDMDDDGNPEILFINQDSSVAIERPGFDLPLNNNSYPFQNLLVKVTNGLGISSEVEYHPLSIKSHPDTGKEIYEKGVDGQPVEYPIIDVIAPMPVVTKLKTKVTDNKDYINTYRYRGLRADLEGRGTLGFYEFTSYDEEMSTISQQRVAHQFPATGMILWEGVFYYWAPGENFWNPGAQDTQPESWSILSQSINDILICGLAYEDAAVTSGPTVNTDGVTYYPVIRESEAKKWNPSLTSDYDAGGNWLYNKTAYSITTTKTWFDNMSLTGNPPLQAEESGNPVPNFDEIIFGNQTQVEVDYGDGYVVKTVNTYNDSETNWHLGRLTSTTVTLDNGDTPITRASSFSYDGNGLLYTETIEPNKANYYVKKTYGRETWGAINSTATNGNAGAVHDIPTTSALVTEWESYKRFARISQNALGEESTVSHEPFRGAVLTQTGPNGKTTLMVSDALGREVSITDIQGLTTTKLYYLDSSYVQPASFPELSGISYAPLKSYLKIETQAPNSPKVTTYYDVQGRVLKTVTESLNVGIGNTHDVIAISLYDEYGRNVAQSEPHFTDDTTARVWSTTEYDPLGRQVESTTPSGVVATFGYNGRFQSTKKDYPDAHLADEIEVAQVNSQGNVIRAWNPGGSGTEVTLTSTPAINTEDVIHEYDAANNLLRTKTKNEAGSGYGIVTSSTYGPEGYFKLSSTDMAMGIWEYQYDALGRLKWQEDAKSQVTTISYDDLGRITENKIDGISSRFYYYSKVDVANNVEGAWVGALRRKVQHIGDDSSAIVTQEGYYYDQYGRSLITLQDIDEKFYYTHFSYNATTHQLTRKTHFWRPKSLRTDYTTKAHIWQSFGTEFTYNTRGAVTKVTDSHGKSWWSAPQYDHRGRVKSFTNGNGLVTTKAWDNENHTLTDIKTSIGIAQYYQDWTFTFDTHGNLKSRADNRDISGFTSQTETFDYDSKHRLEKINSAIVASYDKIGNLKTKTGFGSSSGSGTYAYAQTGDGLNNGRISTIKNAGGSTLYEYIHDANGNITTRFDGTLAGGNLDYAVQWTAFNKPLEIAREGNYSRFVYDSNQSRVISITKDASGVKKQLYISAGIEQIENATSANGGSYAISSQWQNWTWDAHSTRIYISGPTGLIGSFEYKFNQPSSTALNRYWYHFDHQGSIDLITDEELTPTVVAALAYDAWGMPRADAKNWSNGNAYVAPDTFSDPASGVSDRGYTKHEMLAETGLVHMNGRIYDPLAGRFLSPDPNIQFPNNIQNFNRYSYVLNNPLSYTDPSGYFLSGLKSFFKKFWRPILAVVLSVVTAGAFLAIAFQASLGAGIAGVFTGVVGASTVGAFTAIVAGAIGGFVGGLIATGSLKGALFGALSGAVAAGIGNHYGASNWRRPGMEMKRALAHGISGGAISEAQGGKFGEGFFANSFSSLSSYIPGGNDTWGVVRASVIGGTGSVIGGGKFENGAVSGAFTHLFNKGIHGEAEKAQGENRGNVPTPVEDYFGYVGEFWTNAIVDPYAPGGPVITFIEGMGEGFNARVSFSGSVDGKVPILPYPVGVGGHVEGSYNTLTGRDVDLGAGVGSIGFGAAGGVTVSLFDQASVQPALHTISISGGAGLGGAINISIPRNAGLFNLPNISITAGYGFGLGASWTRNIGPLD